MKTSESKINSLSDYIGILNDIIDKKRERDNIFWFRGESNNSISTPLIPGSYRYLASKCLQNLDQLTISQTIKDIENNISADFYRKSILHINDRNITDNPCTRYFVMQHYGINTRLLDWSENAIVALFFAISNMNDIREDATIWILNPIDLNEYSINKLFNKKNHIQSFIPTGLSFASKSDLCTEFGDLNSNELTRRYLFSDFTPLNNEGNYYPIAIYPPRLDKRMSAQKACFTIFGDKINGLSKNEGFIDSVIIKADAKTKIMNELKDIGFDFESIYPDLDGLGKAIKSKYDFSYIDDDERIRETLKAMNNNASR